MKIADHINNGLKLEQYFQINCISSAWAFF